MNIMLFEEFTNRTLSSNITVYNDYLDDYKDSDRSGIVGWEYPGSQAQNFKLVTEQIENGDSILDYGCGIGDFINYLQNKIKIKAYLGVDINEKFIELAKETYKDYKFKQIDNINQINGKWDDVCAIGVFTWYISKEEFIETIYKLYDLCNKQVLLTLLYGETPYKYGYSTESEKNEYWNNEYRYYDTFLFNELFPDLNITYDYEGTTMLIKIEK